MKEAKKDNSSIGRRAFLRGVGIGAGAAGVAAVVTATGSSEPAAAGEAKTRAAGYQETEHVRQFYETARF